MADKLWLKISEVFKKYKTSYSEIIIQITFERLKPNIVGGQVYFNNDELKKVFKIKN